MIKKELQNYNTGKEIYMMLPYQEWEKLNEKVDRILESIQNRNTDECRNILLDTSQVCKELHISYKTFLKYRDRRLISFYQIDRKKILVRRCDLDAFLQANFIPSRA